MIVRCIFFSNGGTVITDMKCKSHPLYIEEIETESDETNTDGEKKKKPTKVIEENNGPKTMNIQNNLMLKISGSLLVKYILAAICMEKHEYKNHHLNQCNLLGTSFLLGNELTAAHSKSNSKDSSI